MSQVGNTISLSPIVWDNQLNWSVMYTYQLDAGGTSQAQVFVGQPQTPRVAVLGNIPYAAVAPWASPTSTITVSPNPPGTTSSVLLPCPPLVQAATFGLPLK